MTPGTPARRTVSESWSRTVPSWALVLSSEDWALQVGFFGLVMFPLGREPLGEQRLLALRRSGRLAQNGLGGLDGGLGGGHRRLLLLRLESGQHLVGPHVVADIDQALRDAAFNPKGQIALDLRADLTRESHHWRILGQGDGLDLHHGRRVLRPPRLLLAAGETQGDYEDHACGGQPIHVCTGTGDHRSTRLPTSYGDLLQAAAVADSAFPGCSCGRNSYRAHWAKPHSAGFWLRSGYVKEDETRHCTCVQSNAVMVWQTYTKA